MVEYIVVTRIQETSIVKSFKELMEAMRYYNKHVDEKPIIYLSIKVIG